MNKLIANERAYRTLATSISGGRLSHALLIEGPDGSGKLTFAVEIAQAAMCTADPDARPCGVCRDCKKVEKRIHPDLLLFEGTGANQSYPIDTVRQARAQAHIKPNEAPLKVIVFRNTHGMTPRTQNVLLKIIEEPPDNVVFVLTCRSRFHMLETIRSRVQVMALQVPTPIQCEQYLQSILADRTPEAVRAAAEQAAGNIGQALAQLNDSPDIDAQPVDILINACIGDELSALSALSKYERDRVRLAALLGHMSTALREAMLLRSTDSRMDALCSRASRLQLFEILAIIEDTAQAVPQNVGGLLLTTSLCARMRSVLAEG